MRNTCLYWILFTVYHLLPQVQLCETLLLIEQFKSSLELDISEGKDVLLHLFELSLSFVLLCSGLS